MVDILFNFESASGSWSKIQDNNQRIAFNLQTEGDTVRHNFLCQIKLTAPAPPTLKFVILNAGRSNYKKGWNNYAPYISTDFKTWHQLPKGHYENGQFSFQVAQPPSSFYLAWYPPYTHTQYQDFLEQNIRSNSNFILKNDGAYISYGDLNQPTVVLIGRQHPGESMASFLLEGFLEALNQTTASLPCSFVFFPLLNKAGVQEGNHRYNPEGVDLNRVWNQSSIPMIQDVKQTLKDLPNPKLFIDCHGDEVSKIDYIFYSKIPKKTQAQLFPALQASLNNVFLLERQSYLKRFIKSLIYRRKLLTNPGKLAFDYVQSSYNIPAFTVEVSAHRSSPADSKLLGQKLLEGLININWKAL